MLIYDYNNPLHKFKDLHDETGGRLKDFSFQYYDCFCGEAGYRIVSTTTRHRNHFTIVQCNACGTLRMNPYMSDASIETYYKEVYGAVKRHNMPAEALYDRQSKSADKTFEMLSPGLARDAKVLDYGSGAGGRMQRFSAEGYEVYIHDYDKRYFEYGLSKGLKAFSPELRYDLVILSHVIEHINHPVEFLRGLDALVVDGGKIYLEVPFIEGKKSTKKLLGDFHLAHKFYFTRESLTHLASMAGFTKVKDFPSGIAITRHKAEMLLKPEVMKAKSDKYISKAHRKECFSKAKMKAKKIFVRK